MKIAFLVTGSGGSFYCSNCYRDMLYYNAIKKYSNSEAVLIPLYLPPEKEYARAGFEEEVYFGAVSLYMREKLPSLPSFLEKILDSKPLLKIAAKSSGSVRTAGHEELTLHMIDGTYERHKKELERLVNHLREDIRPDIVHLSNALVIGLARQIKKYLDIKIVCSLQNEDDWINEMAEPYQSQAWKMIAEESSFVDAFITPSLYFKDFFISKTGINSEKIKVIRTGIESSDYLVPEVKKESPAIGYLSRVNYNNGFDKLVDAFIKIKSETELKPLKMFVCGGFTGDDRPFLKEQLNKLHKYGFHDSVKICSDFHGEAKAEFLKSVDLISVPVRKPDAFGLYVIEANAAGVPVVLPWSGAFPEIIEITGGGVLYKPDTVDELTENIIYMLRNKNIMEEYGKTGMYNVGNKLTMEKMTEDMVNVYSSLINKSTK
ncbi:MAG TPA: glycosyltransferase family 4 protein [Bacteroidales bacterium]|nr:glycosyltransferase family 4 protein [Bacteroidales bacterium]HOK73874.1 glycosyltransferase family 4 protein [Bacteroidales bacterium]HPP91646.1 glycosyltransferase family 4 protein [Bacteroidales bacterium]HRR15835.1 glycosyltransferase family 4 protein [Bacteroidales bacterium]HRT47691.1 glycosyltransferase family 4 protein [Bacteroidales bacterium]